MATPIPLCVDLDGTLVRTDTTLELALVLVKENPLCVFQFLPWLLRGRAHLKQEIASRAKFDVTALPWNTEVLAFLQEQRKAGRMLILATGTNMQVARAVAEHIGLFDDVCASDGTENFTGRGKAAALVERFGKGGFDYAGNEYVDLKVWAQTRRAIVVSHSAALVRQAEALGEVERVFQPPAAGLAVWLEELRIHQWAKNLLIFVPLLGAHQWNQFSKLVPSVLAFFVFSMGASCVYVLNDLLDLEADRHHPRKRQRPLASGRLSAVRGIVAAALLLLSGIGVAFLLPPAFGATFAGYFVITCLYSLRFKQIAVLDVLTLAALYSVRVVAGGYASQVVVSDWLLVFSLFVFLSLAFVKRFTELQQLVQRDGETVEGRGYQIGDRELVSTMGVASGYVAVLVLALYITNPLVTQLYRNPAALWFACPMLLYWISRVWLLARRGMLHDDPIVFALKDKQSWLVCLILLIIGAIALPR